jgi:hypothetical protein
MIVFFSVLYRYFLSLVKECTTTLTKKPQLVSVFAAIRARFLVILFWSGFADCKVPSVFQTLRFLPLACSCSWTRGTRVLSQRDLKYASVLQQRSFRHCQNIRYRYAWDATKLITSRQFVCIVNEDVPSAEEEEAEILYECCKNTFITCSWCHKFLCFCYNYESHPECYNPVTLFRCVREYFDSV